MPTMANDFNTALETVRQGFQMRGKGRRGRGGEQLV